MPKVLFNIGFSAGTHESGWSTTKKAEWISNRAFYTCNASYNYFSYTTNGAKLNDTLVGETPLAYKDIINNQTTGKNYMEKTSGVFNSKGLLSNNQKAELEKKLQKTKSNIWHGFISFDAETSALVNSETAAINFVKRNMSAYFKNTHLEEDNIEAFYSLHSDTDHNHIHFCFFEKKPKRLTSKGNLMYTKKGLMGKKVPNKNAPGFRYVDNARDNFLMIAELYFTNHKELLAIARDNELDILKALRPKIAQEKELKALRASLTDLRKSLPPSGVTGYNSKNMEGLKGKVDHCAKMLLKAMPEVSTAYNETISQIQLRQQKMINICKENKINYNDTTGPKSTKALYDDMWGRLCNTIIKIAKTESYEPEPIVKNDLCKKIHSKRVRKLFNGILKGSVSSELVGMFKSCNRGSRLNVNDITDILSFSKLHEIEYQIELENQKIEGLSNA
jgi:hypothetical protein